ncbi:MAG: hypothetical protein K2Q26_12445 [Bdellovibrionales bacterium]|nr:hypothetical protein [Bdellovibrionales bacterium]
MRDISALGGFLGYSETTDEQLKAHLDVRVEEATNLQEFMVDRDTGRTLLNLFAVHIRHFNNYLRKKGLTTEEKIQFVENLFCAGMYLISASENKSVKAFSKSKNVDLEGKYVSDAASAINQMKKQLQKLEIITNKRQEGSSNVHFAKCLIDCSVAVKEMSMIVLASQLHNDYFSKPSRYLEELYMVCGSIEEVRALIVALRDDLKPIYDIPSIAMENLIYKRLNEIQK